MVIVPLGYTHSHLTQVDEPTGGSPFGAGALSRPDGKRDPSAGELAVARAHGRRVAEVAQHLVHGRRALAS